MRTLRTCSKCKNNNTYNTYCTECQTAYARLWYMTNKDRVKTCQSKRQSEIRQSQAERISALKRKAFEVYGGAFCSCCGEDTLAFLTLDHTDDSGATHRKQLGNQGRGCNFYYWLRKNNYPLLPLKVLCFNCNCGRQINGGICPHLLDGDITLANNFEHSMPGHEIKEMHRPDGHAHLDQKYDKGMRSPWVGQLPMEAGLETPSTSGQGGSGHGDSGYSGGGS